MGFLWKQRKFPRWHENLGLDNMEGENRAKHLREYTLYIICMLYRTGDYHGCGFTIGGKGRDLQWLNCINQSRVDSAILFPRKLGRDYEIRPNFASRPQTRTRSFIDTPTFFSSNFTLRPQLVPALLLTLQQRKASNLWHCVKTTHQL